MAKIISMILLGVLGSCQLPKVFDNYVFEKISNKTWFLDNGFAGESIVFMKTEGGQLKAIWQLNGSGLPIISSEIFDVQIHNDTVYLIPNQRQINQGRNIYYIYSDTDGLIKNGKQLRVLFNEPIIYVWTAGRKLSYKPINLNKVTKILLEKNEIYIKDDMFKIIRED